MKPSGQTTTFTHDNMGRVATQTDNVGTITLGYDNNDNPLTVTEGAAVLIRTFDNMDRVTSYTDASGNTIEYEWDKNGRLTKLTYPPALSGVEGDEREVVYTYDEHNRLNTVTDWANRVTTYHWDAAGRLIGIDRPNGTTRTNQYTLGDDEARQRVDGAPKACPKGGLNRVPFGRGNPQLDRWFERDPEGIAQAYASFGYDLDSRIDWRYRLPKPEEMELPTFSATYDADNRVETWNSDPVTMDDDGNMTFGPLPGSTDFTNYTFDARNRLTGVGGVTYQYDSENNRIAKTTADGTTTYVFDPHGDALPRVLVRERPDESLTYYVYGIGLLYEVDETDEPTYYHFDQSGSTIALTNDAGEVTDRIEYSPYGNITHRTGNTDTPYLYVGQFGIQTEPNGLLHMRARYYSPELKRFINADPAGFDGGLNWYAYANNSPLMYVDPDGEVAFLAIGLAMLAGGTSNVIIGATLAAVTGQDYSWGNAGADFAIGAAFGSLGGAGIALQNSQRLARAAAPVFRAVNKIPRFSPARNNIITQTRRTFLEDTRTFTARTRFNQSLVGRNLNNFGSFELHHVSIQQAGIRRGSQIYPQGSSAASGLQRVGDSGLNLLPVPSSFNRALGANRPLSTSAFGGSVYGGGIPGSFSTGYTVGGSFK